MSVDLVTIVATRAPDLHPSGASKIFHHAVDMPDQDHHISMWSALPNEKPLFDFLLHCTNSSMLLTEETH